MWYGVKCQVPPPSIDFVLPSPTIGLPCLPVVDPPWSPHFKTKVEEVTINQTESVRSVFDLCHISTPAIWLRFLAPGFRSIFNQDSVSQSGF